MTYEFITDRFEVEKLAFETLYFSDVSIVVFDLADLRCLRRSGRFNQAIVCTFDSYSETSMDELINFIKALSIPVARINACVSNFIFSDKEVFSIKNKFTYSEVSKVLDYLTNIRGTYKREDMVDNLWGVTYRNELPKGSIQIQIMFSFEKNKENTLEDEQIEQQIEDYRVSLDEKLFRTEFKVKKKDSGMPPICRCYTDICKIRE